MYMRKKKNIYNTNTVFCDRRGISSTYLLADKTLLCLVF